jgi:rubrerythrin
MPTHTTIDILKEAILLERRGQAFYSKVAEQSENSAVKAFFETMAGEEGHHIEILESQFSAYVQNQQFAPLSAQDRQGQPASQAVLSNALKQQIAAADFEAAAISAAILMEERSISLYSQRAESAQDPAEETLYLWLADWERGHLSYLARLDHEIKEAVWNDRQFWPF